MRKISELSVRKALLLLTTAIATVGVFLGLPVKKAIAAMQDYRMAPGAAVNQPAARFEVIQPRFVNPTAANLLKIAGMALSDSALAERIARDPEGVAAQYHLSNSERLVLRHMTQEQFQTARTDAAQLAATRMAYRGPMRMPAGATDAHLITAGMIVGRAILAAAGRSYLNASNANACCPWSKAIELGINSDPAYYNAVFARPGMNASQPGMNLEH